MEKNKLALCIPAYNAASYLPALLTSAREQEFPFHEILVYNDCSTDETEAVALQYGAKVINGHVNKGCSEGKNALAGISTADWLHFHDADDLLLPNFSRIAQKWMNQEDCADIVLLNFDYRDFYDQRLIDRPDYNRDILLADQKKFVITHKIVNFAICKRQKFLEIGGFNLDQKVLYNEDRAFYSRAIIHGLSFDYEPEITCVNYRYTASMSASNLLKCAYSHYYVSEILAEALGQSYPSEIAACFWQNATAAAAFKDWALTRMNIRSAKRLSKESAPSSNPVFNLLCTIDPLFAFKLREYSIRWLKPALRNPEIYPA